MDSSCSCLSFPLPSLTLCSTDSSLQFFRLPSSPLLTLLSWSVHILGLLLFMTSGSEITVAKQPDLISVSPKPERIHLPIMAVLYRVYFGIYELLLQI